jgi:hypothetical protein
MELGSYVQTIHEQLDAAARAGGEDAQALAERLAAPLDSAIRLALLDALAAAAEEVTVELAPGSVELRLRAGEPRFVVTPPPPVEAEDIAGQEPPMGEVLSSPGDADDAAMTRINLRMPEHLKTRIEAAAEAEGLSVNAWLVRAAAGRLERGRDARRSYGPGPKRYTGWAR